MTFAIMVGDLTEPPMTLADNFLELRSPLWRICKIYFYFETICIVYANIFENVSFIFTYF